VVITNEGLDVLLSIDALNDEMDSLINGLTEQDAIELNKLLDKLREH
jgi:division protein CdvB (Snf7/Vps24/ESCRT-III family)